MKMLCAMGWLASGGGLDVTSHHAASQRRCLIHYGAEAQMGVFHSPKGDMTMTIFNYPTHQIAMQRQVL